MGVADIGGDFDGRVKLIVAVVKCFCCCAGCENSENVVDVSIEFNEGAFGLVLLHKFSF